MGGLTGISGKANVAIDILGNMPRQRRLAGSRITEQTKDLRLAGL